MCTGIELIALAGTAASVGGSIMSFGAQNKSAWEQRAYNAQVEAQQEKYRAELIKYQNVVYKQEVEYGYRQEDYKESEFDRQKVMVANAVKSIEQNLFAQYATVLQRAVEENTASGMESFNYSRSATAARAKARAASDARGVEGSTIEQLIDDVSRQNGEAQQVLDMNRSATQRQLNLEALGLKASADQSLYNIQIQTFAPAAPLNPPQPVSPVQPAAPVAGPNRGAMIANVVGGVVSGMNNYATWSGQSVKQAFSFK
ncbi:virion core protein, T7 gp14 family [Bosea thiooxidans]